MGCLDICKRIQVLFVVISLLSGLIIGITVKFTVNESYNKRNVMFVGFLGELYMSCLTAVAEPMIVISIINGVAELKPKFAHRIGIQFALYMIVSKFFAVLFGMCLAIGFVQVVQPKDAKNDKDIVKGGRVEDKFIDLIRSILPENVIAMFFRHYETFSVKDDDRIDQVLISNAPNYIGIVIVSIVVGFALVKIGNIGTELRQVLSSFYTVTMNIASWISCIMPFCICFKIASEIMAVQTDKLFKKVFLMYLATALTGYFVFLIIIYPLIYYVTVRKNPFRLMINSVEAMATGFATSSTMAAFPYTLKNMEDDTSIDNGLTQFLIPIGHQFHLSGKTMLEGIVPIFVANSTGAVLDYTNYLTVIFLGLATSFSLGPFPCRLSLCSVMVLNTMGLDSYENTACILMLDWLIGRVGTLVDVFGDCVAVGILSHFNETPEITL